MHQIDIDFIGTGNAFAPGGLCWNGFVIDRRFLFEAPPSALMALHRVGIDPNELDSVILSHHHGDHFLGLPFLILHWKYQGRTKPVRIVGPPGTEELTRDISTKVYPGVFDIKFEIEWIEAEPGRCLRLGDLQLEPVKAQHDDRLTMSLGFAASLHGRHFGYTGDTALCEGVLDLARHSEVLISECASRDGKIDIHMNLVDDIPHVRKALRPGAPLILTHLDTNVTADGLADTIVARDFEHYRL
jgi:ribonuclease BN (tRNA processing enzyme)